ncbi:MAG: hypothetical protein CMJ59_12205 [Planctomycetaceae bacterium]|nr:hypothetical protein [Planctomycetaceae bacterium]
MKRTTSIALLLSVISAAAVEAADALPTGRWRLTGERVNGESRGAEDAFGNAPWHFLRTTTSDGPIASRRWIRDGKYVPLDQLSRKLFDLPVAGAIYQTVPTALAPFVGGVRETYSIDTTWRKGELIVAPGPDHAAILAWESPVTGILSVAGTVNNRQTCCGKNSQVNWYLQRGSAPDPNRGFKPTALAEGISDDRVDRGLTAFEVSDLPVAVGDWFYLIVDARADGTATPHYGDGTAVDMTFTVSGASQPPPPTFKEDVLPLLASHCLDCHGAETQEAGLDLRTVRKMIYGGESGSALAPGRLDASYLWTMVESGEMPPEGSEPLSSAQKSLLRRWISAGAKTDENLSDAKPRAFVTAQDREHWAFQPPVRRALPQVGTPENVTSPLDALLLNRLEKAGLTFSPVATKEILARRVYFDLIGLPPTPEQVDAFVADTDPTAYEKLVDRLLSSPRYGERWGRHWMDTVGYVDVRLYDGDATTLYPNEGMWRYRDYIIRSFNADKPYDQFIREQLAGDEMIDWRRAKAWTPDMREKVVATGYLRNIEDHTSEAQYGIDKRYEVMFDMMTMVSTSLLGLTFECTRCHNHKFDPITQRDYYRLMAFFESSYNPRNWLKPQQRWIADVGPLARAEVDAHNAQVTGKVNELNTKIAGLEKAGKETAKGQLETLKRQVAELNASKRSYGKIQALFDVPNPPITNVFRRGDCFKRGIPVTPGVPEVLTAPAARRSAPLKAAPPLPPKTSGRRLALSRWITSRENPMTARVIMNRLWLHHFGEAIVSTPENLGRNGAAPTHPEILEWLAIEFVDRGWSLKQMHRRVLASRAYRQSSRRRVEESTAESVDPDNELLWRQNLKRLESEVIRDSVLAASGRLDLQSFGPPVAVTKPVSGLSMVSPGAGGNAPTRRSVYIFARRVYPLKFLEIFDSPIMAINCSRRMNSTTVLQSFAQLNSDFVVRAARDAATRLRETTGEDAAALVRLGYRTILGRVPSEDEQRDCVGFLGDQTGTYVEQGAADQAGLFAAADLCQMLLCMNEFLYVE